MKDVEDVKDVKDVKDVEVHTPASLASSSLGMPLILLCFTDEHFLFSCV